MASASYSNLTKLTRSFWRRPIDPRVLTKPLFLEAEVLYEVDGHASAREHQFGGRFPEPDAHVNHLALGVERPRFRKNKCTEEEDDERESGSHDDRYIGHSRMPHYTDVPWPSIAGLRPPLPPRFFARFSVRHSHGGRDPHGTVGAEIRGGRPGSRGGRRQVVVLRSGPAGARRDRRGVPLRDAPHHHRRLARRRVPTSETSFLPTSSGSIWPTSSSIAPAT